MRNAMKFFTLGLCAAVLSSVAPAAAGSCDDAMVIFSGHGPLKPNLNALGCSVPDAPAGDTRIINPGSSEIFIRYSNDFGVNIETITATVLGLGLDETVELHRTPLSVLSEDRYVYDSEPLAIDPMLSGCIRTALTQNYGGANAGSTAFHTYDSVC